MMDVDESAAGDFDSAGEGDAAIEIDTAPNPQCAVIWLHGLGSDGHDFEPMAPVLAAAVGVFAILTAGIVAWIKSTTHQLKGKKMFRFIAKIALLAPMMCAVASAQSTADEVAEWRISAEQGDAAAQTNLGDAYDTGEGITQDKREAVRWWHKAAEQGNASAQYNLGIKYLNGEGVIQDQREAVRWYRKAAEQGNAAAQNTLGVAYWDGEGVTQDKREAVRWWHKAAEQENAAAQNSLGHAYLNGEGVITDEKEAYIWYSIAKVFGDEDAAQNLRNINWQDYLSPADLRAAKTEAKKRLKAIEAGTYTTEN